MLVFITIGVKPYQNNAIQRDGYKTGNWNQIRFRNSETGTNRISGIVVTLTKPTVLFLFSMASWQQTRNFLKSFGMVQSQVREQSCVSITPPTTMTEGAMLGR